VSIVVRRLGNTDDIAFSTGLGGVDGATYGTIAILFRPSADPVYRWLVKLRDISGVDLGGVGVLGNGTIFWKGASTWATEGPVVTFGDWHLLVARKETGDVRPRFSLQNVTTNIWDHDDAVDTQLDWVAPTGGSIRTKDAVSGEGPDSDYAAAAFWANELPWAADTFGDAEIEAANLDEHLDNWRDADPASGWEFSQSDANSMVEDFTLNRADETSVGVGTPTTVTDLDFIYATASILALSRNYLRSTQDEPGAGGIIRDLSETQGTPTTIGSGAISSGSFVKVLEFWRVVGATVDASVAIDTSISMSAVSASTLQYQWRVHRYNSADVEQEASTPSSAHNTVGVKTQTMALAGPFVAGDKLALSLWLRKAGGGGSRSFTLDINNPNSWVEFSVAEVLPAIVTASIPLTVTVAPTVAADHAVTANIPLTVAVAGTVQAPSDTGLISGTVSANPVTLSCGVGERLICIAFSRGGGTGFAVTPNAGGASWINRVAEATLPANDLARRSLGVAELVPTSTVTDGLFTAAWSADPTDAIWLRVQQGGAFGFADAAVADSDTGSVTFLATGDTASIPAGDLLLLAAAAIRDGGAAGIGWANTDVNPGLVGGGNLLLDAYAGKGAGGNAGVGGYLILDGQGAGVRADTVSLPGGDAGKRITAALVVWSTGVTATPQVTANIPLTIAVAGTTEAEHQVTAGVELGVALAGTTTAQHQATAEVDLTVALAGTVATDHTVTATVPLALALAPVVDAPEVGAPAEVTANIPLTVTVAGTSQADHQVTTAVPLTLATAGTVQATHQVTTTLPLALTIAPVVDAPVPGAPNQVTTNIPLGLTLAGTTTTGYQATAGIPLTLTLAPTVATDHAVTALVALNLGLTGVIGTPEVPVWPPVAAHRTSAAAVTARRTSATTVTGG
jgi:hypothetical protein